MQQATLWASVLRSKKAIVAGVTVFVGFVTATLEANGGNNLTWKQWVSAGIAWVFAHLVTYGVRNSPKLDAPVVQVPVVVTTTPVGAPVVAVEAPAELDPTASLTDDTEEPQLDESVSLDS